TSAGTYTAAAWVRGETAGAVVTLRVREYNNGTGLLVGTATQRVTLTTTWQQVTVPYSPIQPGASTLDFHLDTDSILAGAACFDADDISIAPAVNPDAPAAALTATPPGGAAALAVSLDASRSVDADATPISSYRFDFGDGTAAGPQTTPAATHT